MTTHLEHELENIKLKIFNMTDAAIEAIGKSIESLKNSNIELAEKVIENDSLIDRFEIEIDDACINTLVTKQPAATDLRLVLSFLKINTDLERIGDLATNIAKETIRFDGRPLVKPLVDVPRMAAICVDMIKSAFEAMTARSVDKASEVIKMDEEIDRLNLQIYRELFTYMAENPQNITQALGLIMVSKALERIGDHATNIAERVIYYIEGVDIRHKDS